MTTTQQEFQDLLLGLFPQGSITEDEYLLLTDRTSQLIEYTDGYLEVLAMPIRTH